MKKLSSISIIVLITYLAMVTVNGLANALPINGMITGAISDSYPNLFAPTGITFIIWGVIYLLLAAHTPQCSCNFEDVAACFSLAKAAMCRVRVVYLCKNAIVSTCVCASIRGRRKGLGL